VVGHELLRQPDQALGFLSKHAELAQKLFHRARLGQGQRLWRREATEQFGCDLVDRDISALSAQHGGHYQLEGVFVIELAVSVGMRAAKLSKRGAEPLTRRLASGLAPGDRLSLRHPVPRSPPLLQASRSEPWRSSRPRQMRPRSFRKARSLPRPRYLRRPLRPARRRDHVLPIPWRPRARLSRRS